MDTHTKQNQSTREERLIDLGAEIRKKEAEISDLRREFQRLLVQGEGQPVTIRIPPRNAAMAALAEGVQMGMVAAVRAASLPKKLLAQMQASPDSEFRAEDFLGIGGADDIQSVRTSLSRLCDRDGLVERVDRGLYRLRREGVQTELPVAQV